MKSPKIITKIVVTIITLTLITALLSHHFLPQLILKPRRISSPYDFKAHKLQGARMLVESEDGLELSAYYVKSKWKKPKATILLLHGIGSCKEHMLHLSNFLSDIGYSSIVMDHRAHGKSGGSYCTYGYFEKMDISRVVNDYLKYNPSDKIGIWGNSLGGAIALQSMAHDSRIEFGIIQSTFTDLSQIVHDYQKRYTMGLGSKLVSDYALSRAGKIANFDPKKVRPVEAVRHIDRPVLILHGTKDKRISFQYGQTLYDSLASADKKFVPIVGAGHNDLSMVNDSLYFSSIQAFLGQFAN